MKTLKVLAAAAAACALFAGCGEKGTNPPTPATHTLTTSANPAMGGKVSVNGTASTGTTTTHNAGAQVTATAAPNTGYKFTGWSGASASKNASVTVAVNSDITLTANFQLEGTTQPPPPPSVYTLTTSVTPSSSAGTVSPASGSYEAGEQISLTAIPEDGYEFSYWTGSASGSANPTTVIMGSNMSITAVFTPIGEPPPIATYAVTFNSNGGSSVPTQTVTQGGYVAQPANPTRAGYTFDGWYSNIGLTMAWDFDENIVDANTTLYAKWTESQVTPPTTTYTVTFNSNGGSSVPTQTVAQGGYATQPANPTRSGYTFDGWYSNTGLTAAWDFSVNTVNTNTTLYARWADATVYTLGTGRNRASYGTSTRSPSGGVAGTIISISATANSGYEFENWTLDYGTAIIANPNSAVTTVTLGSSNVHVIANFRWEPWEYTGSSVTIGTQTWMAENLNNDLTGYCYKGSADYCAGYGRLYDWFDAMRACPIGWHLPTEDDWLTLINYAGGQDIAGKKLKSTSSWAAGGGTNDYGFSALPGGAYGSAAGSNSDYYNFGTSGCWWSAQSSSTGSCYVEMSGGRTGYPNDQTRWWCHNDGRYLSIRCVQD